MTGGPPDWSDPRQPSDPGAASGPGSSGSSWSPEPPSAPPGGAASLLRQRRATEIIDATLRLYREQAGIFLPLSAMVMIPTALIQALVGVQLAGTVTADGTPDLMASLTSLMVAGAISAVGTIFLAGAVARVTAELCLGMRTSAGGAIRFALSKLGVLVGVAIVFGVIVILGTVLLIIPGIFFAASLAFASIVVVVEGARVFDAIGRSWALSRGRRWKIIGVYLLTILIVVIVGFVVGIPVGISGGGPVAEFIGNAVVGMLTAPITTIALTLLYFDIRIRKEAFDLSVMAQELGPPGF